MNKTFGILLAIATLALGTATFLGIKSALEKAERERAEREAFNAAADAEEKLAAYCSDLRKETRELKRRAAKIEELIEDKRTNAKANAFHEGFERRLELLDSVSAHSMSTLESASHDYYRELLVLNGKLRELLIVKESESRSLNTDDDGINEAYAKATDDLTEIRVKMHDAYAKELDLLLSKNIKAVGLSENMQSNAVESIKTIIAATCEGTLGEHMQSLENITNALPAQTLQIALHRSCTNAMAVLETIETSQLSPHDIGAHKQYRKCLIMKDERQNNYLNTLINALLKKSEGESAAKAIEKARDKLERMKREVYDLERWFPEVKKRERESLLTKTAETLDLSGADIDYFVTMVSELIAALGSAPI